MGRWSYSDRIEADGLNKLSITFLKKHGYLSWMYGGTITWTHRPSGYESKIAIQSSIHPANLFVRFIYTQTDRNTGEKKDFDYKVSLITSPCNLGGVRYWFKCPLWTKGIYCGRRVGTLCKAGNYFGCRHCYNLTYASRKLSGKWKLIHRVISGPEIEELEAKVKRKYYNGKITRRYKNFLLMREKHLRQLSLAAQVLGNLY